MRYLVRSGGTLAYTEAGRGPLVVLVHGLGASRSDWRFQLAALSSEFRVVTPDLPGFGDSSPLPGRPTIDDYAAAIEALVAQLSPDAPVVLGGHSMGGAVALQAVLRAPARYHRLIIANSLPSFQPERLRDRFEFAYRRAVVRLLGPARLARLSAFRMFPHPHQTDLRAPIIARGLQNRASSYLQALTALTGWNALPRLAELTLPVLLLAAEHDYFGRDRVQHFADALPRARLQWFEGARHGMPMERPEDVTAAIRAFLQ